MIVVVGPGGARLKTYRSRTSSAAFYAAQHPGCQKNLGLKKIRQNLSPLFAPMLISPCPVNERSGVHTEPSGTGPASWVVLVSAGQEAFDSFARPFERRFRRCETAVKPGDRAWTLCPVPAVRHSTSHSAVWCRIVRRARERGNEAQNRRNGAPQGALYKFRMRLSAPRPLSKAPGRQVAEGFGVGIAHHCHDPTPLHCHPPA